MWGWELARWHLEGMYGRVDEGVDEQGYRCMRIMSVVDIKQVRQDMLVLEWESSVSNDMVADSVMALLLSIDSCPATVKMTMHDHVCQHAAPPPPSGESHINTLESLFAVLEAHFGDVEMLDIGNCAHEEVPNDASPTDRLCATIPSPVRPGVKVALDDEPAIVSLDDMVVYCETESLKHRVERLVAMVRSASTPIVDAFHLTPACSSMLFQGKHNQVKLEQNDTKDIPRMQITQ